MFPNRKAALAELETAGQMNPGPWTGRVYPFTVDRWNKTYEYKNYFEAKINKSIYMLLLHIEKCIYR